MTEIVMTLWSVPARGDRAPYDVAQAHYRGRLWQASSRNGATMVLARDLVAAGVPDGPWRAVDRDGRSCFGGGSLHRLAGLTVKERDRQGLRIEGWTPAPDRHANSPLLAPDGAEGVPHGSDTGEDAKATGGDLCRWS